MARKYRRKQESPLNILIFIVAFLSFQVWNKTKDLNKAVGFFVLTTIALAFIVISISKIIKKKKDEKLIASGIDVVDTMPGLEFEKFVLAHFERQGYKGEVTRSTHDYGADLILKKDDTKIVVQAKRWKDKVGITAIQEVVGAIGHYGASKGLVITNNYFTPNAKALAKSNNIELWDRDKLIEIMSKNQGKEISETVKAESQSHIEYCPKCGNKLVERKGKNGLFLGCSSFPKCRFTKNIAK